MDRTAQAAGMADGSQALVVIGLVFALEMRIGENLTVDEKGLLTY